jgi:hypothetical protein
MRDRLQREAAASACVNFGITPRLVFLHDELWCVVTCPSVQFWTPFSQYPGVAYGRVGVSEPGAVQADLPHEKKPRLFSAGPGARSGRRREENVLLDFGC